MSAVEIKRPGRAEWETSADLSGVVPIEDAVGTLVRYPSGVVIRITGLTEPDESGKRNMLAEVNDGTFPE